MSKSSRCRWIYDRIKRNECIQREEDAANKETDVYGLDKYKPDKNSPLAKMSFEELLAHAKNTRFGGKTKKRKSKKSKKSKKRKTMYKRKTMSKRKK